MALTKLIVGPCVVCGGRPLRSGKRQHDAAIHAAVRARRDQAWLGARRWPRLQVERVRAWWEKREEKQGVRP